MNGSFQVTANGIPAPSFSTGGPLPPNVTLTPQGVLSGTPTVATGGNTYPFTLFASNGVAPDASQAFSLFINRPPLAGANSLGAFRNTAATMSTTKILLSASDPDGDSLTVSAVSPVTSQGGTASLAGNIVTYTPANNYVGNDILTYSISDGRGGSTSGTVQVTVSESNVPSLNIVSLTIDGSGVTIVSQGIPGFTYRIQSTDSLAVPFADLSGTLTANATGRFTFLDSRQPGQLPPNRYYRAVSVP